MPRSAHGVIFVGPSMYSVVLYVCGAVRTMGPNRGASARCAVGSGRSKDHGSACDKLTELSPRPLECMQR
jgi:hypothetical protein